MSPEVVEGSSVTRTPEAVERTVAVTSWVDEGDEVEEDSSVEVEVEEGSSVELDEVEEVEGAGEEGRVEEERCEEPARGESARAGRESARCLDLPPRS